MNYKPRQMPSSFTDGMPEIVLSNILDLFAVENNNGLKYEVIFSDVLNNGDPYRAEISGIDFGEHLIGQHFYMHPHEMSEYRKKNSRNRISWVDLPEKARACIIAYITKSQNA